MQTAFEFYNGVYLILIGSGTDYDFVNLYM